VSPAPAVFLSDGSPTVAIEPDAHTRALRAFGDRSRPRAVAVVSAHWNTSGLVGVTSAARPAWTRTGGSTTGPGSRCASPGRVARCRWSETIFEGFQHGSLGMRSMEFRAP
jgi:hypothetical protein